MKKIGLTFLILCASMLTGCVQTSYNGFRSSNVDMSVREISVKNNDNVLQMLDEARSAVVGISVSVSGGYTAIGSGVAISSGGYILTNNHVIEDGKDIKLYYADKTTGVASVLWNDPAVDMAILKSSREIPYLSTEDLNNTFVGEDVYAIGTPLTLEFKHTVTKGIVSAMDRTLESESDNGTIYLQSLVQHDASINPGNSGGPLITSEGKVIGLNTLKASEGEGIAFAVPIKLGKIIVSKLKENKDYKTPYMGVFAFDSDLAEIYNQNFYSDGVYVYSTTGPAKQAGLKKGDIITYINDKKISNMLDFRAEIYEKDIDDIISVTFERDGVFQKVDLKLTKR